MQDCDQQYPAWYVGLCTCWIRVDWVGGIRSMALLFWANNSFCAWFTDVWLVVRSYNNTINCSISSKYGSIFWGIDPREQNAPVTASRFSHVAQAVFLPLPWKKYTTSQSLSAWKNGRAKHLLGPDAVAISWTSRNLTCLSTPYAIHNWIWLRHWNATTTSVSTVRIVTLSQPS